MKFKKIIVMTMMEFLDMLEEIFGARVEMHGDHVPTFFQQDSDGIYLHLPYETVVDKLSQQFKVQVEGIQIIDETINVLYTGIAEEELEDMAYLLYKKDWCHQRGYSLKAVEAAEIQEQEYNGSMYVCKNEFLSCEFQDEEYMSYLMGAAWKTLR